MVWPCGEFFPCTFTDVLLWVGPRDYPTRPFSQKSLCVSLWACIALPPGELAVSKVLHQLVCWELSQGYIFRGLRCRRWYPVSPSSLRCLQSLYHHGCVAAARSFWFPVGPFTGGHRISQLGLHTASLLCPPEHLTVESRLVWVLRYLIQILRKPGVAATWQGRLLCYPILFCKLILIETLVCNTVLLSAVQQRDLFIPCCCYLATKLCPTLVSYRLQLARLLCLLDFPGKNTGVVYHSLLHGIFPFRDRTHLLCLLHWKEDSDPESPGKPSVNEKM